MCAPVVASNAEVLHDVLIGGPRDLKTMPHLPIGGQYFRPRFQLWGPLWLRPPLAGT
jgi:hypothetical protein